MQENAELGELRWKRGSEHAEEDRPGRKGVCTAKKTNAACACVVYWKAYIKSGPNAEFYFSNPVMPRHTMLVQYVLISASQHETRS